MHEPTWSHTQRGGVSYTLNAVDQHAVCYAVENHPQDSRVRIDESGTCQTLPAKMGTGGGNTPMILMAFGGTDAKAAITNGTVAPTMLARAGTGGGQRADSIDWRTR